MTVPRINQRKLARGRNLVGVGYTVEPVWSPATVDEMVTDSYNLVDSLNRAYKLEVRAVKSPFSAGKADGNAR